MFILVKESLKQKRMLHIRSLGKQEQFKTKVSKYKERKKLNNGDQLYRKYINNK